MRRVIFLLILGLMMLFATACSDDLVLYTFGNISGTVQDARAVSPLAGVKVALTPTGYSQVTGIDGSFQFDNLDVQEYTLTFTKDGFQPLQQKVTVKPGLSSSVQVSMTPLEGSLMLTPSSLDFGTTTTSLQLQLRNKATAEINYTAQTSSSWITVSPKVGTVKQSEYMTVLVSRSGLSPGKYDGEILFRYSGESLSVPVSMEVLASETPVVTLEKVLEITSTTATLQANLVSVGTSKVTQMGFCWSSENETPSLSDKYSNQGDTESPCSFNATVTGLTPRTTYHCRAYARNSAGVAYSTVLTFTTSEFVSPTPEVSITGITDVTSESATLTATLSSVGTSKVIQMGFCWSSSNQTPTLSDKYSNQGSTDSPCSFNTKITDLTPSTTYYCRAYARNSAGLAYSPVMTFTTTEYVNPMAEVSIIGITDLTSESATLTANLSSVGTTKVTQMGFCWSSSNQSPTLSDKYSNQGDAESPCSFNATVTGLNPSTTYYCRAYAINAAGTSFSEVMTLITTESSPGGSSPIVPQGLIAYYTFDNSNADDFTENGLHGGVMNSPDFIDDTPSGGGKCLRINGMKNQSMQIQYMPFKNLNNYSISLWIKDFSSGALIYGLSTNWGAYYDCPRILMLDSGFFEFKVNASSSGSGKEFVYPYTSIQSSYWHHLVFSCSKKNDSSNALLNLYVDGVLVDSIESSFSNNYNNYGVTKIVIGGDREGSYTAPTMKLDNIRIYSRALTRQDAESLYNGKQ